MKSVQAVVWCVIVMTWSATAFCEPSSAEVPVLVEPTIGDPDLMAINSLTFAPGGILIVSDGARSKIAAIQTNDVKPLPGDGPRIENVAQQIGARLGGSADDVEIIDLAVNPVSRRTYIVVKKHASPRHLIVTVDPAGELRQFPLTNVPHVTVNLPAASGGSAPRLAEIAWAGDRLVATARSGEEFGSKIIVIPAPLGPGSAATMYSAETYHISHRRWETKAPMQALFPYEENGTKYIVGGFGCTPIVKYPIDAIQPGAQVRGLSMIELGSGNRPLNMFSYRKGGKDSVLVNTFRFHHEQRPFGPSPYWTCRFDHALLAEEKSNEEGFRRPVNKPDDEAISVVQAFHGVMHMDRADEGHAVVIRMGADRRVNLELVELP
jgi:hypothetical protein